jgi:hypothetical protein
MTEAAPIPAWQRWLLPDRPGMPHFLFGAVFLVLPAAARGLGTAAIIPAMAVAAILGGGLGLGWLLACGVRWLRAAPVTSLCVFAMSLGCLGHLYIMPRWEVMLRAHAAAQDAERYLMAVRGGAEAAVPTYDAGPNHPRFRLVERPADDGVALYTPEPLQRWTPFGYRDSCWLAVRRDGSAKMLKTAELLRAELDAAR